MVTKTISTSTVTARALPKVGLPSMMSIWAFKAGTPGTSNNTDAIRAISTLSLSSSRAKDPPMVAATQAITAATTKALTLRCSKWCRRYWPTEAARAVAAKPGQSTPSKRPKAAQATPTATAVSHGGWRGVSLHSRSISAAVSAAFMPPCATRAASARIA